MNQERCMEQPDTPQRSCLRSGEFPAEPWHSTPRKKFPSPREVSRLQDARSEQVARERDGMVGLGEGDGMVGLRQQGSDPQQRRCDGHLPHPTILQQVARERDGMVGLGQQGSDPQQRRQDGHHLMQYRHGQLPHSTPLQQRHGQLPHSTSLPLTLTPNGQMSSDEVENSGPQRRRRELQLLMAELRERDEELNKMAAAHHAQLLAWQQDRQRTLQLEEKCARLQEELAQQDEALRAVGRRAKASEDQEKSSQRELRATQLQLQELMHTQRHENLMQNQQEERIQALDSTVTMLSSQVGQLQAREEELSTMLKLKDKDVTEAIVHIQDLSARLQSLDNSKAEWQSRESKLLIELETLKRNYRDIRHENSQLKGELQEKTLENSTQREELIRFKQESELLRRDLAISGEEESWKDEMLMLCRSKQERTEAELHGLRLVCDSQHNDLQLLTLNLERTEETLREYEKAHLADRQRRGQRSRDSGLGTSAVDSNTQRSGQDRGTQTGTQTGSGHLHWATESAEQWRDDEQWPGGGATAEDYTARRSRVVQWKGEEDIADDRERRELGLLFRDSRSPSQIHFSNAPVESGALSPIDTVTSFFSNDLIALAVARSRLDASTGWRANSYPVRGSSSSDTDGSDDDNIQPRGPKMNPGTQSEMGHVHPRDTVRGHSSSLPVNSSLKFLEILPAQTTTGNNQACTTYPLSDSLSSDSLEGSDDENVQHLYPRDAVSGSSSSETEGSGNEKPRQAKQPRLFKLNLQTQSEMEHLSPRDIVNTVNSSLMIRDQEVFPVKTITIQACSHYPVSGSSSSDTESSGDENMQPRGPTVSPENKSDGGHLYPREPVSGSSVSDSDGSDDENIHPIWPTLSPETQFDMGHVSPREIVRHFSSVPVNSSLISDLEIFSAQTTTGSTQTCTHYPVSGWTMQPIVLTVSPENKSDVGHVSSRETVNQETQSEMGHSFSRETVRRRSLGAKVSRENKSEMGHLYHPETVSGSSINDIEGSDDENIRPRGATVNPETQSDVGHVSPREIVRRCSLSSDTEGSDDDNNIQPIGVQVNPESLSDILRYVSSQEIVRRPSLVSDPEVFPAQSTSGCSQPCIAVPLLPSIEEHSTAGQVNNSPQVDMGQVSSGAQVDMAQVNSGAQVEMGQVSSGEGENRLEMVLQAGARPAASEATVNGTPVECTQDGGRSSSETVSSPNSSEPPAFSQAIVNGTSAGHCQEGRRSSSEAVSSLDSSESMSSPKSSEPVHSPTSSEAIGSCSTIKAAVAPAVVPAQTTIGITKSQLEHTEDEGVRSSSQPVRSPNSSEAVEAPAVVPTKTQATTVITKCQLVVEHNEDEGRSSSEPISSLNSSEPVCSFTSNEAERSCSTSKAVVAPAVIPAETQATTGINNSQLPLEHTQDEGRSSCDPVSSPIFSDPAVAPVVVSPTTQTTPGITKSQLPVEHTQDEGRSSRESVISPNSNEAVSIPVVAPVVVPVQTQTTTLITKSQMPVGHAEDEGFSSEPVSSPTASEPKSSPTSREALSGFSSGETVGSSFSECISSPNSSEDIDGFFFSETVGGSLTCEPLDVPMDQSMPRHLTAPDIVPDENTTGIIPSAATSSVSPSSSTLSLMPTTPANSVMALDCPDTQSEKGRFCLEIKFEMPQVPSMVLEGKLELSRTEGGMATREAVICSSSRESVPVCVDQSMPIHSSAPTVQSTAGMSQPAAVGTAFQSTTTSHSEAITPTASPVFSPEQMLAGSDDETQVITETEAESGQVPPSEPLRRSSLRVRWNSSSMTEISASSEDPSRPSHLTAPPAVVPAETPTMNHPGPVTLICKPNITIQPMAATSTAGPAITTGHIPDSNKDENMQPREAKVNPDTQSDMGHVSRQETIRGHPPSVPLSRSLIRFFERHWSTSEPGPPAAVPAELSPGITNNQLPAASTSSPAPEVFQGQTITGAVTLVSQPNITIQPVSATTIVGPPDSRDDENTQQGETVRGHSPSVPVNSSLIRLFEQHWPTSEPVLAPVLVPEQTTSGNQLPTTSTASPAPEVFPGQTITGAVSLVSNPNITIQPVSATAIVGPPASSDDENTQRRGPKLNPDTQSTMGHVFPQETVRGHPPSVPVNGSLTRLFDQHWSTAEPEPPAAVPAELTTGITNNQLPATSTASPAPEVCPVQAITGAVSLVSQPNISIQPVSATAIVGPAITNGSPPSNSDDENTQQRETAHSPSVPVYNSLIRLFNQVWSTSEPGELPAVVSAKTTAGNTGSQLPATSTARPASTHVQPPASSEDVDMQPRGAKVNPDTRPDMGHVQAQSPHSSRSVPRSDHLCNPKEPPGSTDDETIHPRGTKVNPVTQPDMGHVPPQENVRGSFPSVPVNKSLIGDPAPVDHSSPKHLTVPEVLPAQTTTGITERKLPATSTAIPAPTYGQAAASKRPEKTLLRGKVNTDAQPEMGHVSPQDTVRGRSPSIPVKSSFIRDPAPVDQSSPNRSTAPELLPAPTTTGRSQPYTAVPLLPLMRETCSKAPEKVPQPGESPASSQATVNGTSAGYCQESVRSSSEPVSSPTSSEPVSSPTSSKPVSSPTSSKAVSSPNSSEAVGSCSTREAVVASEAEPPKTKTTTGITKSQLPATTTASPAFTHVQSPASSKDENMQPRGAKLNPETQPDMGHVQALSPHSSRTVPRPDHLWNPKEPPGSSDNENIHPTGTKVNPVTQPDLDHVSPLENSPSVPVNSSFISDPASVDQSRPKHLTAPEVLPGHNTTETTKSQLPATSTAIPAPTYGQPAASKRSEKTLRRGKVNTDIQPEMGHVSSQDTGRGRSPNIPVDSSLISDPSSVDQSRPTPAVLPAETTTGITKSQLPATSTASPAFTHGQPPASRRSEKTLLRGKVDPDTQPEMGHVSPQGTVRGRSPSIPVDSSMISDPAPMDQSRPKHLTAPEVLPGHNTAGITDHKLPATSTAIPAPAHGQPPASKRYEKTLLRGKVNTDIQPEMGHVSSQDTGRGRSPSIPVDSSLISDPSSVDQSRPTPAVVPAETTTGITKSQLPVTSTASPAFTQDTVRGRSPSIPVDSSMISDPASVDQSKPKHLTAPEVLPGQTSAEITKSKLPATSTAIPAPTYGQPAASKRSEKTLRRGKVNTDIQPDVGHVSPQDTVIGRSPSIPVDSSLISDPASVDQSKPSRRAAPPAVVPAETITGISKRQLPATSTASPVFTHGQPSASKRHEKTLLRGKEKTETQTETEQISSSEPVRRSSPSVPAKTLLTGGSPASSVKQPTLKQQQGEKLEVNEVERQQREGKEVEEQEDKEQEEAEEEEELGMAVEEEEEEEDYKRLQEAVKEQQQEESSEEWEMEMALEEEEEEEEVAVKEEQQQVGLSEKEEVVEEQEEDQQEEVVEEQEEGEMEMALWEQEEEEEEVKVKEKEQQQVGLSEEEEVVEEQEEGEMEMALWEQEEEEEEEEGEEEKTQSAAGWVSPSEPVRRSSPSVPANSSLIGESPASSVKQPKLKQQQQEVEEQEEEMWMTAEEEEEEEDKELEEAEEEEDYKRLQEAVKEQQQEESSEEGEFEMAQEEEEEEVAVKEEQQQVGLSEEEEVVEEQEEGEMVMALWEQEEEEEEEEEKQEESCEQGGMEIALQEEVEKEQQDDSSDDGEMEMALEEQEEKEEEPGEQRELKMALEEAQEEVEKEQQDDSSEEGEIEMALMLGEEDEVDVLVVFNEPNQEDGVDKAEHQEESQKQLMEVNVRGEEKKKGLKVAVLLELNSDSDSDGEYSVQMAEVKGQIQQREEQEDSQDTCQSEEVSSPQRSSPVFWTALSPVGHSRTIYHASPPSADHCLSEVKVFSQDSNLPARFQEVNMSPARIQEVNVSPGRIQEVGVSSTQRLQRLLEESRQMVTALEGLSLDVTTSPSPSSPHSPAQHGRTAQALTNGHHDDSSIQDGSSVARSLNSTRETSSQTRRISPHRSQE